MPYSATSRTTWRGSLSSRSPLKLGALRSPACVYSANSNSATSRGSTKCAPLGGRPRSNGEPSRSSGRIISASLASMVYVKLVAAAFEYHNPKGAAAVSVHAL